MIHEDFKKFDTDKVRVELVEPSFIVGVGKVLTYGAEKYEVDNWKKGNSEEDKRRISGALMRHLLAYNDGEEIDPETGISHLYHAGCNLMFLSYFDENKQNIEDVVDPTLFYCDPIKGDYCYKDEEDEELYNNLLKDDQHQENMDKVAGKPKSIKVQILADGSIVVNPNGNDVQEVLDFLFANR